MRSFFSIRPFSSATVSLGNLKPAPGSHKRAKRRGRGIAAHGHSCGRGANGQKSRTGGTPAPGFAGGQTPFVLSMPKRGFTNPNAKEYAEINLDRIQHLIDTGRLDATKPITIKSFIDAGINGIKDGVKVLGAGHHHFTKPIEIHASRFTQSSIRAIEQAGGRAISVFHTPDTIRCFKNPERFWRKQPEKALEQLDSPSKLREKLFYSQTKSRGYLAPDVMTTLTDEFKQKYKLI